MKTCLPSTLVLTLLQGVDGFMIYFEDDLVDRIKVAQGDDDILQGFLTSVEKVTKGEDGVIRYEG